MVDTNSQSLMKPSRRSVLVGTGALAAAAALPFGRAFAQEDTIRIGFIGALSGIRASFVRELKRDHAIIWIEHIAHALKSVADRILVLHYGKKLIEGPPAEVMSGPIVREIYMGSKADGAG